MVIHAFNLRTWEVEAEESLASRASLVYRGSALKARATQKNTVFGWWGQAFHSNTPVPGTNFCLSILLL